MSNKHSSKITYDQLMNSARGVPSATVERVQPSPDSPQIDLSLAKDPAPAINASISLPNHDTSCFKVPKIVVWILAIVIGVAIGSAIVLWMRRKANPVLLQLPSTSSVAKENIVETASETDDDIDMDSIDVIEEVAREPLAVDAYEEDEYFTPL